MTDSRHPDGHVLLAYHDGELDQSAAAGVASHCEHCESCRAELTELDRVGRLLTAAPAPELSRSVWPRLKPDHDSEPRLRPAFAFSACAVGIVLGVLLGPIRFNNEETTTELALTEIVTIWDGEKTDSLLDIYQSVQE